MGNKVAFLVNYTGIGIENDQLKTLFDPCSSAENKTNAYETGMVINLNLVKQIVTKMGGEIFLSSLLNSKRRKEKNEFLGKNNFHIDEFKKGVEFFISFDNMALNGLCFVPLLI